MRHVFAALVILAAALTVLSAANNQSNLSERPAVAVEPIAAITDALGSHLLVSLPSGHGNEQIEAFERSLVRDARFASTVDDIVVEFGNARYQDLIDRFVSGGDLPAAVLRQGWQNTTVAEPTWDSPLTEEFFQTVRATNASLPRSHRIRVLLGDPPIDWNTIHTNEDYRPWLQRRDTYPADVIKQEVLAKHRRALVVYGQIHAQRKDLLTNFESGDGLFGLERNGAVRVFSVWAAVDADLEKIQADVASWPLPSLAIIRGTVLGSADFTTYYPAETPRFDIHKGQGSLVPRDQWRTREMEDQFDAVLYLAPPSAAKSARVSPELCADAAYVEMRVRRMALAGLPARSAAQFKEFCASVASK